MLLGPGGKRIPHSSSDWYYGGPVCNTYWIKRAKYYADQNKSDNNISNTTCGHYRFWDKNKNRSEQIWAGDLSQLSYQSYLIDKVGVTTTIYYNLGVPVLMTAIATALYWISWITWEQSLSKVRLLGHNLQNSPRFKILVVRERKSVRYKT